MSDGADSGSYITHNHYKIIIIIFSFLPSVVKIPRVESKAKSKRNAGTARSRPQGLCGRKCHGNCVVSLNIIIRPIIIIAIIIII